MKDVILFILGAWGLLAVVICYSCCYAGGEADKRAGLK